MCARNGHIAKRARMTPVDSPGPPQRTQARAHDPCARLDPGVGFAFPQPNPRPTPACFRAQKRSRPLPVSDQIAAEQHHIDHAYSVLEAELDRLQGQEEATLARGADDATALTERDRSEEHTSELQSRGHLVCR